LSAHAIIRDYPISLTVGVNGRLQVFAAAFHSPTFATFSLLVVGAVRVRGRHTVTRMIFAAGVRATHHARFHRFFSGARWRMDDLWQRLALLVAERLLAGEAVIGIGIDDTAQGKTGARIYGGGMVYDNRPKARQGDDLRWGLTWVVTTVMVEVPQWQGQVFAVPVMARRYRREGLCRREKRPFQTKPALAREVVEMLVAWLPQRRFRLPIDGGYNDGKFLLWTAGLVQYWSLTRPAGTVAGWRPRGWAKHRQPGAPPRFSEMLAALRRDILSAALFHRSASQAHREKTLHALVESVAFAA
jgi:hypothetical protein